jgi:hypothetical protein
MNENANEIFDYLPISRSQPERDYIDYLWNAVLALDQSQNSARPFIMMPFHLLFILALQYKVLRIAREQKTDYDLAFTIESVRDDQRAVLNPASAFDLGLLSESKIIDLLKIVGLAPEKVREIKLLVRNRNDNLAHAKGGIEPDPDERIDQYLDAVRVLQPFFMPHNNRIADHWLNDIDEEDTLDEFIQVRLPDSQLCPADFKSGDLILFNIDGETPQAEWEAIVSKIHAQGSPQGILWLKHIAQNHADNDRRLRLVQMLEINQQ